MATSDKSGSFSDLGAGLGRLAGNVGSLFGLLGPSGQRDRMEAVNLWANIQRPEFDIRSLTPPQLKIVAEYFPSLYDAKIREVAQTQDSPEARRSLQGTLSYLESVRNQGLPLSEEIAAREARRAAQGAYQATVQGGLRDLAARGMKGSGAETALRLGAGQQAANLSRGLGEAMMRERVANRMAGAQGAGNLAALVRGQDVGISSQRASEMNNYNALVMNLLTNAARNNALSRQEAQWQNAGLAQNTANSNELLRYRNDIYNQNNANRWGQQGFANNATQVSGQANALSDYALGQDLQQAANRDNIMSLAEGAGQAAGGFVDWLKTPGKTAGSTQAYNVE